jgi:hypothetical protein
MIHTHPLGRKIPPTSRPRAGKKERQGHWIVTVGTKEEGDHSREARVLKEPVENSRSGSAQGMETGETLPEIHRRHKEDS